MASADILRAARDQIEDPKNWTQGAFARDANGNEVMSYSDEAVCWCAYGAIRKQTGKAISAESALLSDTAQRMRRKELVSINDFEGHASVLRVFDAAIAAAEAEAGR